MMTGQFRKQWRELQDQCARAAGERNRDAGLAGGKGNGAFRRSGRSSHRSTKTGCARAWRSIAIPPPSTRRLLDARYRGTIYRSDLESDNAYNTYRHAGLPPGPIANPGVASLKAALAPAETDYLYFVAKPDGSGGHQFSKPWSSTMWRCSSTGEPSTGRPIRPLRRSHRAGTRGV